MAGTIIADSVNAAASSTLVLKNGVANTPPTIQDSAGTQVGTFCRAWVNFNGTGTVAIRDDFNVSSITDGGTGVYTVNFTTAMPDANYAVCLSEVGNTLVPSTSTNLSSLDVSTYAAGSVALRAFYYAGSLNDTVAEDVASVFVAVFR